MIDWLQLWWQNCIWKSLMKIMYDVSTVIIIKIGTTNVDSASEWWWLAALAPVIDNSIHRHCHRVLCQHLVMIVILYFHMEMTFMCIWFDKYKHYMTSILLELAYQYHIKRRDKTLLIWADIDFGFYQFAWSLKILIDWIARPNENIPISERQPLIAVTRNNIHYDWMRPKLILCFDRFICKKILLWIFKYFLFGILSQMILVNSKIYSVDPASTSCVLCLWSNKIIREKRILRNV